MDKKEVSKGIIIMLAFVSFIIGGSIAVAVNEEVIDTRCITEDDAFIEDGELVVGYMKSCK